ncbi:hypothetical protein SCP_0905620 [Sparassis crispa]|uniref:Thioesterase/thiol ester dehydrase-isomerase n=1 Tax=Sparassis crispa TaxID=139825 RepID=A0A401GWX2_9APHY|nr:hypothetical protein SCP_0905620 [Sparassis crispa]GBE86682.1 hypothetical protein SCP_0905620 [Sparassis crispa]
MISAFRLPSPLALCRKRVAALPNQRRCQSSIRALQDAFRDPSSPFHIPPGTKGPASPDPPAESELLHTVAASNPPTDAEVAAAEGETPAAEGRRRLLELGYDPSSFWEQHVVWGDHDAFQHVNNVRYVRFFESSRIQWMCSLGEELGGPDAVAAMLAGRGVSLILKSLSLHYKRPVVYPDTLLVAHGVHSAASERPLPKTHFHLRGAIWSYAQRRIVTECDSVLVWYDYDKLAKCDPGPRTREVLLGRMQLGQ